MITAEMLQLDTLSASEIRKLEKIDAFRGVVQEWRNSQVAEVVDYSNQSTFTLGNRERTLEEVIFFALTKLVVRSENDWNTTEKYSKTAKLVSDAWDILRAIKVGKEAQGIKFNLDTDTLRAIVEASL